MNRSFLVTSLCFILSLAFTFEGWASKPTNSDEAHLTAALQQMQSRQIEGNHTALFQLILAHKVLASKKSIAPSLKNAFTYMEGYTQMVLGDESAAQESFNKLLTSGEEHQDTSAIIQSLTALAQLYTHQYDYPNAEKYLLLVYDFKKNNSIEDQELSPDLLRLIDHYIGNEQFGKAEKYVEEGLNVTAKNDLVLSKVKLLLYKVNIALAKRELGTAEKMLEAALDLSQDFKRTVLQQEFAFAKAKVLNAKGHYRNALKICKKIFLEEGAPQQTLEWYNLAQELCLKTRKFQLAYEYLLQENRLRKVIQNEQPKKQLADYLSMKLAYEKAQQEKAFAQQAVSLKSAVDKFRYALFVILCLGIAIALLILSKKKAYKKKKGQVIDQRIKELENNNTLLGNSNKELKEFTRILAHDLRAPLRNIVGFSALARKELKADSNTSNYLRYVLKSGKRLRQLITDISVFHNVEHTAALNLEPIDGKHLMKAVLESIELLLEEKNAEVICGMLPIVYSHQPSLLLVFKHIIENGIKYNDNQTPKVQIQYLRNADTHFFRFKDNGIGISSVQHEVIFDMFKRIKNQNNCEGSGLGLNVGQKMLEKINGKITLLDSALGEGSTFQISFPILLESERSEKHINLAKESFEKMPLTKNAGV